MNYLRDARDRVFAVNDEYLNGYAKLCGIHATGVYMSICRHASKEQTCFPSKSLMAAELAISERSVYAAVRKLESWGIISIEGQGRKKSGEYKSKIYTLIDKKHWKPKPQARGADGTERQSPQANDDIHRRHVVPKKDTHSEGYTEEKDTQSATPSAVAPFSWRKYLEAMHEHKNRHVQIIAFYFQEKHLSFQSKGQVETAIRRHLRAAKSLAPFSDEQLVEGARKSAKDYPEWTLETLIKVLTR